jgi:hypothetical protein
MFVMRLRIHREKLTHPLSKKSFEAFNSTIATAIRNAFSSPYCFYETIFETELAQRKSIINSIYREMVQTSEL